MIENPKINLYFNLNRSLNYFEHVIPYLITAIEEPSIQHIRVLADMRLKYDKDSIRSRIDRCDDYSWSLCDDIFITIDISKKLSDKWDMVMGKNKKTTEKFHKKVSYVHLKLLIKFLKEIQQWKTNDCLTKPKPKVCS